MLDPREDAQAYIEKHNISKLFQVTGQLLLLPFLQHARFCPAGVRIHTRKSCGPGHKSRREGATTSVRYTSTVANHAGTS